MPVSSATLIANSSSRSTAPEAYDPETHAPHRPFHHKPAMTRLCPYAVRHHRATAMRPLMPWRRVPVLLTVAALAAVSACSGSSSSSAARPSTAPASTASAVATATATPSATSGATPASTRVGLLTEEFTTPLPADPARAKVATDFEQALLLWDKSQENFG